jgi:hypothetical protein
MLCRVALLRTDVSEEIRASNIRITRIGELGTTLAIESDWRTHGVSLLRNQFPKHCYLYKIWGFHGGDYEEYRLLGHKNPVYTSHETHYVSTTEPQAVNAM